MGTWLLHQQKERCTFCGENREKHSEKLWNIHEETVPKNAKLATIPTPTRSTICRNMPQACKKTKKHKKL